ncbi:hypothetical protein M8C21_013447, partial [Ambrosia artemisiifolia]
YLEAILDVGPGLDDAKSSLLLRERGRFSPTRYFVDNVIGFDETDLHRSWVKVSFDLNLHGLIRGENMELGRDSDTGGQVKYVVELARALASMPGVYRVDLLTRQVACPEVDSSYGEPIEMLCPHNPDDMADEIGESSGAYIIRIPFGPREKYIPKELLWPHIPEFVDGALSHVIQMSKVLGEQLGGGHPVWPVAIHGHYADAGDSAARLSGALNVPMLFTGHSLGRDKLEQLLRQGRLTKDEINDTYKIMRRIEAEESSLDSSEVVITSTRQEIDEQWRLYDGFDPVLEKKLRARIRRNVSCYGRFMPRMVVIPPGMEFNHIVPHDGDMDGESEEGEEHQPSPDPPIWTELNVYSCTIMRFFTNPRKPMILALARPDPKKNLTTLVKAFGECRPLRELANLTLIMGNRENIDEMSSTSASMLLSIIKLIDKYDLYGQVAYPKHHKQSEVAEIYRLAAKTKVPPVKELRKLIRIQALRCHVIYCQNGKKINVIPVSASRSQALSLMYLYLRWGMDLSKVVVFVGESGDTDYEGFLGGVHKSVVLKGIGSGTTNQLHANRVYPLSDVIPTESTNIIHTPEECSPADIRASLGKLGVLKA